MLELFLAEFLRSWRQFRRYAGEAVGLIGVTTILFYGLFLGARYVAGPALQLEDKIDSIIVGYVLWTLVLYIISDIAGNLQEEAQTGTLEQLFLSKFSATKLLLMRTLASLTLQMVIIFSILFIIMGLTGSRLTFTPVLLLPFITVLTGTYGMAFILGAIALLLKRVQQLIGVVNFILLFLLVTPTETWSPPLNFLAQLLPITPGAGLLRDLMARGESLSVVGLGIAIINGGFYLAVGLILFHLAERRAKQRGTLTGY
ncbi:ABC transporter permease [Oculatella sp. LEGE 06141]|nr:ABC transporter permease [Oculatella sp. LEGE 06141]